MSPARPTIDVAAVAARTMLCTLSCSAWRATRQHKAETEAVQQKHHTTAPRVAVKVCEHPALTELSKLHQAAYTAHRRITLPSVQDGMRMLPAARQFEHADTMREFSDQHRDIVSRFLADYSSEAAAAPVRLNGLYDSRMWPSQGAIANKFGFGTRYLACPTDGAWADWLAESARAATDDLYERLREALERVSERCGQDGRLHASVFDQLRDVVALVPDLDLIGSPGLQAAAQAAAPLAAMSADVLREDAQGRKAAAQSAASILTLLGGVL